MENVSIIKKIAEQAELYSDDTAIEDAYGGITFRELKTLTAKFAAALLAAPAGAGLSSDGGRVGLLLPRIKEYMPAMYGVIQAGGSFIFLDTEYPSERRSFIAGDTGMQLVITTERLLAELNPEKELGVKRDNIITVENVLKAAETEVADFSAEEKEALILYTSGTTGQPKGVVHTNVVFRGISEFCKISLREQQLGVERPRYALLAGLGFMATMHNILCALWIGGRVSIFDGEERRNLQVMADAIKNKHIDGLFLPPKMAKKLLLMYPELPLKFLLLGGEKANDFPKTNIRLIERYAMSEAYNVVVTHQVEHGESSRLLGRVCPIYEGILLDEENHVVTEPGAVGELCLLGDFLSSGYLNRPEETAVKFAPSPVDGRRMFRTGDLMTWLEGGNLEFHGRADNLVKLNGFRIELGEIDEVMRGVNGVAEAVDIVKPINGTDHLFCYYEVKKDETVTHEALKEQAEKFLPEYMVPSVFEKLDEIPRNQNGKVDRKVLKELSYTVPKADAITDSPKDELEKFVCEAFAEVLDLAEVGPVQDFGALGGDSISCSMLLLRLSERDYLVTYKDVQQNPTPRQLAEFLRQAGQVE